MKRKNEQDEQNAHIQKFLIEITESIEDPVNKEEFYSHFLTLSSYKSISKELQSSRINKILIPQLYYKYALKLNEKLTLLSQNTIEKQLKELTEIEEEVDTLKSLFSLQKIEKCLSITIQTEIAKSYELIADIQYDIFDCKQKKPIYLLEQILKNYSKSLRNKFDTQVWLSIINTRQLLIEKFNNSANGFYEKEILLEIDAIIDEVTNFSFEIDEDSKMTMISHGLYACVTGYQLDINQSQVYIQKAFNLIQMNLNFLIENQNNTAYEDLYRSMLGHLKTLGINKNIETLKPNSTI